MDTSIAHSKCFLSLEYSPQTAPTRPVLWLTPAVNDSTALDMLFTAEPTVSKLRQRSRWRVCEFWIRISSFALEPFNAPIIDVTPMARAVVEARRLAGSLGSGSGTLGLGDLDRSSSFSSLSAGDLLPSSGWGIPCSSPFSDSVSTGPACANSGGFSERGNSGAAGRAAFAMNLSSLWLRARCTRWERPGPRYSLGILGNFTIQIALIVPSDITTEPGNQEQNSCFSHPKVRDSHLNRWSTLPIKTTLNITPRCVPHILTGNVQSITTQCLRQKQKYRKLVANCKLNPHPTANACTTLHKTAKQITVVSAHKTHRHVMQKNENSCKARDSWQNYSRWVPQVQVPSSPKLSKTLKFQDISKLLFHSNLSLTALSSQLLHFSSQLSAASKPSNTTRPGTTTKTYTLGGDLPTQTILWASAANLYNKLPFSSNSKAFIVPCQRYSLGLYFRRIPASAFWR